MTKNELNKLYFQWMCRLVCTDRYSNGPSYNNLLFHLNKCEYHPSMIMDENRADDGMDLRYRFGYENAYEGPMIATFLDDRPCSMLEMMIALSIHCENIMGDRAGDWFWNMISNLGLSAMFDEQYNPDVVDDIIVSFSKRQYRKDGLGGLFYIPNTKRNMRKAELWYQMCWYLDEKVNERGIITNG